MESQLLISAIVAVAAQFPKWLELVQELLKEEADGPISLELREKAKKARMDALAIMHSSKGPAAATFPHGKVPGP